MINLKLSDDFSVCAARPHQCLQVLSPGLEPPDCRSGPMSTFLAGSAVIQVFSLYLAGIFGSAFRCSQMSALSHHRWDGRCLRFIWGRSRSFLMRSGAGRKAPSSCWKVKTSVAPAGKAAAADAFWRPAHTFQYWIRGPHCVLDDIFSRLSMLLSHVLLDCRTICIATYAYRTYGLSVPAQMLLVGWTCGFTISE